MRLFHIALRNIQRHPGRALVLAAVMAAAVGVVTTLYVVTRSADLDVANKVDEFGANIAVVPRSQELPLVYGGVELGGLTYQVAPLSSEEVHLIRTIENKENINRVAPKLLQAMEVGGTRILAVGVDWEEELGLKKWWEIEGERPAAADQVLLGAKAAQRLAIGPGDQLELGGRSFSVAGVIGPTGSDEDDVLFLDLATAQELWQRPGQVSFVEVSAWCSTCPIEDITAQISALLPGARVSALSKAVESRELLVDQFRVFSLVLSVFMVVASCLVVLASTLASVRSRTAEIGVFRAVGFRRWNIMEIVLLENLLLAVAATAIGLAASWLLAGPLARVVAGLSAVVAPPALLPAAAALGAVVLVMLASLYPAWIASSTSPMRALRGG